ncbi:MAG: recombinase family protein [Chloroflexota bacterium]|nr:recombinase family protein [Chloroflexota bacterium]
MKATIYCRVSTHKQEDNYSLGAQEQDCREYAAKQGWEVSEVYREAASGVDLWERPQLTLLRDSMRRGEFQFLLVWKLDRLSRETNHQGLLFSEAERAGVSIDSATEDLDDSFQGKLVRAVAVAIAEAERQKIVERTHRGRVAKLHSGRVLSHVNDLYGYRYDPATETYRTVDPEVEAVRLVFDWYLEGTKLDEIVSRLNAMGAPVGSAYGWTRTKVSKLVAREEYATGQGWANRYYSPKDARKHGTRERPRDEWITVAYPPLIDMETWERAKRRRQTNKFCAPYNRTRRSYILAGLLWCSECGKKFGAVTTTATAKRREYRYYECRGMRDYPHVYDCRSPRLVRAEEVEAEVWGTIEQTIHNPDLMTKEIFRLQDQSPKRAELEARLGQSEQRLGVLTLERQQAIRLAVQGTISETELKLELARITEQTEFWAQQKQQFESVLSQQTAQCNLMRDLYILSLQIEGWGSEQRREVARQLIRRVTVDRSGEILITMSIPEDFSLNCSPLPCS